MYDPTCWVTTCDQLRSYWHHLCQQKPPPTLQVYYDEGNGTHASETVIWMSASLEKSWLRYGQTVKILDFFVFSNGKNTKKNIYKRASRGRKFQKEKITSQRKNLPIECVQGDQPVRCPNRGFCVHHPWAVPSDGGVFVVSVVANCYLTELLLCWAVTWLRCYLTELLLFWTLCIFTSP